MDALQWVDKSYAQKHKADDPHNHMYYQNLMLYSRQGSKADERRPVMDATKVFFLRFARRGAISLVFYALSYLPGIGPFVLPAASLYSLYNAVGPVPSLVIFFIGLFLPRRVMVVLLQSYFSSRSLMRELVCAWSRHRFYRLLISLTSSNRTLPGSSLQRSRDVCGSVSARPYYLDSALGTTDLPKVPVFERVVLRNS